MASARRLIVNADDFGASRSINEAVIDAHQSGVLTTASLMVNGAAADEAVHLARENPRLGVGLHLTLCCGAATLPPAQIPALVNHRGDFRKSPLAAGMLYFFSRSARQQLAAEIKAQFDKFAQTGLPLDHVNGHLHFHLHPAVFQVLLGCAFPAMRLTHNPASIDWALGRGRWFYRASHSLIFARLANRSRPYLKTRGIAHTDYVFGLLETSLVTEDYILKLLPRLPAGDSELYSHPCAEKFQHEHAALISPRVRAALAALDISLIRYRDLWRN
jgi:chitin disaccharide deacetylase